jgi:hypothetical protein
MDSNNNYDDDIEERIINHEPISSIMVVIFLSIVVAQFWNIYGL